MAGNDPIAKYGRTEFVEPKPFGYLYLGARVAPPRRAPFVRASRARADTLTRFRGLADQIRQREDVVAATVYEAVVIPPVADSPRFDVLVLIRTTSPQSIAAVQHTAAYRQFDADFVMPARNTRRIGDIDAAGGGAFLFNHFTVADSDAALGVFDSVSTWFTAVAGVRHSALLQPTGESRHVFVNHVRLPCGPVRFLLRFARPSFRRYVTANLNANGVGNAPVFCRPVCKRAAAQRSPATSMPSAVAPRESRWSAMRS